MVTFLSLVISKCMGKRLGDDLAKTTVTILSMIILSASTVFGAKSASSWSISRRQQHAMMALRRHTCCGWGRVTAPPPTGSADGCACWAGSHPSAGWCGGRVGRRVGAATAGDVGRPAAARVRRRWACRGCTAVGSAVVVWWGAWRSDNTEYFEARLESALEAGQRGQEPVLFTTTKPSLLRSLPRLSAPLLLISTIRPLCTPPSTACSSNRLLCSHLAALCTRVADYVHWMDAQGGPDGESSQGVRRHHARGQEEAPRDAGCDHRIGRANARAVFGDVRLVDGPQDRCFEHHLVPHPHHPPTFTLSCCSLPSCSDVRSGVCHWMRARLLV